MIAHHYGTDNIPRKDVKPSTFIKYKGRTYLASANISKGLHINTVYEKTLIKNDEIEVYLNQYGKPLMRVGDI
ncbi:cell division protein FtsZ [Salmonella enterica]|nr:cell division protein FtsZ [Salmonella enterica]